MTGSSHYGLPQVAAIGLKLAVTTYMATKGPGGEPVVAEPAGSAPAGSTPGLRPSFLLSLWNMRDYLFWSILKPNVTKGECPHFDVVVLGNQALGTLRLSHVQVRPIEDRLEASLRPDPLAELTGMALSLRKNLFLHDDV